MTESYYAHTGGLEQPFQLLRDHNRNVGMIAAKELKSVGLHYMAYIAGLMHDLGKYTGRFQEYLLSGQSGRRGSVIHTFQACKLLMNRYHLDTSKDEIYLASELIAIAIGSHHGLIDCVDGEKTIGLDYRSSKENMDYEEAVDDFFKDCVAEEELDVLLEHAASETKVWIEKLNKSETGDNTEFDFSLGLMSRLLTSAVVEADRSDTARFINGHLPPAVPDDMQSIWRERLEAVEKKLNLLPNDTAINRARRTISDQCRKSAEKPAGIYRLYVPTGGGKTLSSLRYALAHATKYNKKRLIFTSPLLSILEQNAAQIRDYVGDDSLVLEHHSNVVQTDLTEETLDQRELLAQSWEAPIIITTLVQFLNTLFDGRMTCVRRFHALCDSVILIDEVQSVPMKLLSLFNRAIHFLCSYCKATVVLCSATQPSLEEAEHPLREIKGDIVPYDPVLWEVFSRTRIVPLPSYREESLPEQIRKIMEQTRSLLVVCNKKSEAARLVKTARDPAWNIFHLSAGMCVQHRRDVLAKMTGLLEKMRRATNCQDEKKILCVSTQVIEAGVDISFESAMRFTAGMDSVIQTAGRCNRNGEKKTRCPVYLVNCSDERLDGLQEIRCGKDATIELLSEYELNPGRFSEDLSSDKAIGFYYSCLYRSLNPGAQDYVVYSSNNHCDGSLYDYLSSNEKCCAAAGEAASVYLMHQAFKTAGEAFSVFDQDTIDVLVPYKDGEILIRELCSEKAIKDLPFRASLLKRAHNYTVSLYRHQKEKLEAMGALYQVCGNSVFVLQKPFYDDIVGVKEEAEEMPFLEV